MNSPAARAAAWLSAWDSQGIHRTATAGDEAGAAWLANEAALLGADVAREAFTLDRIDPVEKKIQFAVLEEKPIPKRKRKKR